MVDVPESARRKIEWLDKLIRYSAGIPGLHKTLHKKYYELADTANLLGEDAVSGARVTTFIHPATLELQETISKKYFGKPFKDLVMDYIREEFQRSGLGDPEQHLEVQFPIRSDEVGSTEHVPADYVGLGFVVKSPRYFGHAVLAVGRLVDDLFTKSIHESVKTSKEVLNEILAPHGLSLTVDPAGVSEDFGSKLLYSAYHVEHLPSWLVSWVSRHRPPDEESVDIFYQYLFRKLHNRDKRFLDTLEFARKFPELQGFVHPRAFVELAKLVSDRNKRAYVRPVSGMHSVRASDILDNLRERRDVYSSLTPEDFRKLANALALLDKGDPYLRALAVLGHKDISPQDLVTLVRTRDRDALADDLRVFLNYGSLKSAAKNLSFSKSSLLSSGPKGNVSVFKAISTVQNTPEAIAAERILKSAGISPKDNPHAFLALVNAVKRSNLVSKINSLPEDVVRFELQRTGATDLLSRFVQTKSPADLLPLLARLKASRLGEYEKMLRHEVRGESAGSAYSGPTRLSIDPFIELIDTHPALEQVRKGIKSLSDKKRVALRLYQKFGGDVNKAWSNHRALKRAAKEVVDELNLVPVSSDRGRSAADEEAVRARPGKMQNSYLVSGATAAVLKLRDLLGDSANVYVDRHGNLVFDTTRILAKHGHEETHALKAFKYLQPFGSFHHEYRGERVVIPAEHVDKFIAALHNLGRAASGDSARKIHEFAEALSKMLSRRSES